MNCVFIKVQLGSQNFPYVCRKKKVPSKGEILRLFISGIYSYFQNERFQFFSVLFLDRNIYLRNFQGNL